MKRYCPFCGGVFEGGRCPCQPHARRKPTANDKTRMLREPWRRSYSDPRYLKARQEAIARTKGRCTDCGRQCAWHDGVKWRTAGMGGEVDHVKALCEGGTNDPANLELRCKSCHGKRDARRRSQT